MLENEVIEEILDNCLKICVIEKDEKSVKVYFSDDSFESINDISLNRRMNLKYRQYRLKEEENGNIQNDDLSTVWILIADNEVLQVGRNKNLNCMISGDLNPNRNAIVFRNKGSKYGKLLYSYNRIYFYEVCIDKYLESDDELSRWLKQKGYQEGEAKELIAMNYYIKASYVEGKIAALTEASMWNCSGGIDGDIYKFYKNAPRQIKK